MAAEEEMRRDIARQMHDGPAQSIANIALQAQVVERLLARDPQQAAAELRELVTMVQGALERTKTFIFDVRPMVLDDLGLVPTLRRTAAERSRRSGMAVGFESVGADARLGRETESALFRIVDDALSGMLDAHPAELVVRLDWTDGGVQATVRGRALGAPVAELEAARRAVAVARRDKQMPAALASMIHEQESVESRGLSEKAWAEIRGRAESMGIPATLSSDGWLLEASATRPR
jgi:two-component system sensor histidine kinase DegS